MPTDDLRDRIAAALEARVKASVIPADPLGGTIGAAQFFGATFPELADTALAVVTPELERQQRALDGAGQHIGQVIQRAEQAEAERDAARLIVEELQALRATLYGQLDSAVAERDALKAAATAAFSKLHALHLFGSSGQEFTDTIHHEVLAILNDALTAPETAPQAPAPGPTADTRHTDATRKAIDTREDA